MIKSQGVVSSTAKVKTPILLFVIVLIQVQAIEMFGAAHTDFFKSETNGGIKNIISHHLKIIKRCVFSPNLEGVAQKISLPRPWEV